MFWLILISFVLVKGQFKIPELTIEILQSKGFKASVPDERGIKLFAFDAKLNEVLGGRERGTFSKDITEPENGKWTFTDESVKLRKEDVLYYRYYVDHFDGRSTVGYTKIDKCFIEDLIDESEDDYTIFKEDFDSDLRSRNTWNIERRYSGAPDYEFNIYLDSQETLEVKDNLLRIKPVQTIHYSESIASKSSYKIENCTGNTTWLCEKEFIGPFLPPAVISSQISTKHKFSFRYGTIVVRAKLPKGDWLYPEIFLNPLTEEYGADYNSGQIRIAYVEGNSDTINVLQGGIILGNRDSARQYGIRTKKIEGSWSDDFHDFAVKWTPDNITVMVDNITYGEITPPNNGFGSLEKALGIATTTWSKGSKMAPFDQNMYITLGVGAGGFNFVDRPEKPWKNLNRRSEFNYIKASNIWNQTWGNDSALEVDYVKVFEYEPTDIIPDVSKCNVNSVTVYNGKIACKGALIFNYFFYNLYKRYWKPEIRFAGMPDYEFVVYTRNDESMYIGKGRLIIKPIPTEVVFGKGSIYRPLNLGKKCTGKVRTTECSVTPEAGFILPAAVSSQITTKNSFVFKYGTIEIRAKMPKGDWIYPELFLMPVNTNFGPDYDFGQIRIAFVPGNQEFDKTLYGGTVLGRDRFTRRLHLKQLEHISSWCDDFHKFSVVWKPDEIALYVDGTSYGKIKLPISAGLKSPKALFDKEMYITIGVGVGGFSFEDDKFPNKSWTNGDRLTFKKFYNASSEWLKTWGDGSALEVDYVKVWAL